MDEEQRKQLLEQVRAAIANNSSDTAAVAVLDIVSKARAAAAQKQEDKPAVEQFDVKDFMKLQREFVVKTNERLEAIEKGAAPNSKAAARSVPFEYLGARNAAHGHGYAPLPLGERMTMTARDMREAGIMDKERETLVLAQETAARLYTSSVLMRAPSPAHLRRYEYFRQMLQMVNQSSPAARAMDEFTAGEGKEWVPDRWTGVLLDRINQDLKIEALFQHITMNEKTQVFGIKGAKPSVYYLGNWPTSDLETAIPASTPGTGDLSLTCEDLYARVIYGVNFSEDAAWNVAQLLQDDLVLVAREAREDAIMNGDTAGALDSGYSYALSPRLAFDGIRKLVPNGNRYDVTTGATAFEATDIDAVRLLMGDVWGADLGSLVLVTSFLGQMRISGFTGVQSLADYGPNAAMLKGEVGNIRGVPIVVSQSVGSNLNASGRYDNSVTSYTTALVINKRGFIVGDRKQITLESGKMIETQQQQIVMVTRLAFARRYGTTEPNILGEAYKIS